MEYGLKPVEDIFTTYTETLYDVIIDERGSANSETITYTKEHPFYTTRNGVGQFVYASQLRAGDKLFNSEHDELIVRGIRKRAPVNGALTYNFEVKDFHTYFVGENSIWVHNISGPCADIIKHMFNVSKAKHGEYKILATERFQLMDDALKALSVKGGITKDLHAKSFQRATRANGDKLLQAFVKGDFDGVGGLDGIGSYRKWNNLYSRHAIKRARQVDIHHIIPKAILQRMQKDGLLPNLHVDIDIPCVPLDAGIHRAFTTPMNRDLINHPVFINPATNQLALILLDPNL